MAFKHKIYPDLNLAVLYNFGQMTMREGKEQIEALLSDPEYKKGMCIIRDTTAADLPPEWDFNFFHNETPPEIRKIWQQLGHCKLAWVTKDGNDYKIAHQASISNRLASTDHITRRPFRSLEEAKSWLGIPLDYELVPPAFE